MTPLPLRSSSRLRLTVALLVSWACGGDLQLPLDSAPAADVDRLAYLMPPGDVGENETFSVEVALLDQDGGMVPLSGIFIYVDLFPEGKDAPVNKVVRGERFENTENGVAVLELTVEKKGRYRLRALTDDLPELGPHGPEPYLFSGMFEVK